MKVRRTDNGMLVFWCPGCNCAHGVNSGWTWNGSLDKPTFSPSILVRGTELTPEGEEMIKRGEKLPQGSTRYPSKDVRCHSFVKDGMIQFLGDCTHELKNKTVEIPEWPQ